MMKGGNNPKEKIRVSFCQTQINSILSSYRENELNTKDIKDSFLET